MKNKFLRIASALLVLTLLSTCAVSGTYAKYVTSASGSDTARVAKFGVEIATWSDSLFAHKYAPDTENYEGGSTVVSVDQKNVVAPGTKNKGSISFGVTGTPEVAVKVAYELDIKSNVCVKAGTYNDFTTADKPNDTFKVGQDYEPIKFTLWENGTEVENCKGVSLEKVKGYLEIDAEKEYAPNTDLATKVKSYKLAWEWEFDDDTSSGANDKADTLLGQKAAGIAESPNITTNLAFDLKISVTQID